MTDELENYYSDYDYGQRMPLKIKPEELTDKERDLLVKSDVFCMLPWIHLHAYPDGRAYPCCLAKYETPCWLIARKHHGREYGGINPCKICVRTWLLNARAKCGMH